MRRVRPQTSIDIFRERNELRLRVGALEQALVAVERETGHALHSPELAFLTVCRIETIARQARLPNSEED